jgi:hypothetical protein
MAPHLHGRFLDQPPNIGVDLRKGKASRVRHPDVFAVEDDLGLYIAQSGPIFRISDLNGAPPFAGQRPSKAIVLEQGLKL